MNLFPGKRAGTMNIYICDDCAAHAERCRKMLLRLAGKNGIRIKVAVFSSSDAFLFQSEDSLSSIDLVYLDIHMPGMDGIAVAQKLRAMGFAGDVVFYTVSPEYAIEGYDVSALHYVVKGRTTNEKFEEIFLRAYKQKRRRECEVLILTCAGESRCIPIESIRYFEIRQRIITVYYEKDHFEFYSTMMRMEEQLFQKGFIRTHKSFLVNKRCIRSINKNDVVLDSKEVLPVGKRAYADSLRMLGVNAEANEPPVRS